MAIFNEAGFDLSSKREGCILYAYDDANDQPVRPGQYTAPLRQGMVIPVATSIPDLSRGLARRFGVKSSTFASLTCAAS